MFGPEFEALIRALRRLPDVPAEPCSSVASLFTPALLVYGAIPLPDLN